MKTLWWFVAYLVALEIAYLVAPEDTILRAYIGVFFAGGGCRGILNTFWREKDD